VTETVVIDSSVAYKWLRSEREDSVAEALALAERVIEGDMELIAPATMPVELANAIRYAGLPEDATAALVEEIASFPIVLYDTDAERLQRATELALLHHLTVYDALFLQLAEELGGPLVTADRRAFAGVHAEGVEIRLL
jgi:predicted nucleic acid-binding protein